MLPPNSSISTSLSNNSTHTLPQHIIDELRSQIKKIADTLNVGWDNEPSHNTSSRSNLSPYTSSSLIDTFPDASFSALDPNFVLSQRHVPLPPSRPNTSVSNSTASCLQLEISNVTNVHKNLSV
ncbi:hypothetical protein RhiirA5_442409 [Rhizophagus irregularis]|uniref:Uncharacterized protein n=1 Tax=Rhizophagus irregularis TaxID=588596 RepID=A0A2N0NER9_9GLOM|nr:hypothetical protein RhiirA5_442409 [Rhizophagus irregularis]